MFKNKKALVIVLSAIAAVLLVALAVTLILVLGNDSAPDDSPKVEGPEAGVYYFDAGYDEYTLTLNAGDTFALIVKGKSELGSYTLNNGALTLDFDAEDKENASATLDGNVVTIVYEGASMRFLKKINYTVTFETNGGTAEADVTVINGKMLAKPADPVRDGYLFVGWYADSDFKTPFAFGAQPITSDTTVYARWSDAAEGGTEYTVKLDLGYEDALAPESVKTVGGRLFDLPTPTRDGYEFKGWWISMEKDGSKLSYRYEDGAVLNANTTLYALWQSTSLGNKLPAPVVNVAAGTVSWEAVSGARSYDVRIVGPSGNAIVNETTGSTTVNVPFGSSMAGRYVITVTANANSGEANNSEAVRYYVNKALDEVSVFNVVGSTLVYNTVAGAEKYLISVTCGNEDHNHTDFDNGTSRIFNFANCEMTAGGIRFTVTAVADGYASSTSDEYVYVRNLPAVEGLRFDAATELLRWNEVADAAYYMVAVSCGNSAHSHDFVNVGTKTFVSLKECAPVDGGIVVKVYPVARGYNSPTAVEYVYEKENPATPAGLVISGTTLGWNEVAGATSGYEVRVGDTTYKVSTNSFDLSPALGLGLGSRYEISVRAIGEGQSLWSDPLEGIYWEMGSLSYSQSVLSWEPVIGITSYEVQVNGGEIFTVSGTSSTAVTLTRAGVNLLRVRFVNGSERSEWAELEVFAHSVVFDTQGGSDIVVQYKAVGDRIVLPTTPTKDGYQFDAWYNVPGGPVSNGRVYDDEFFAESGSIVLYANYTPNKYKVTYNYGEGSGDKTSDDVYYGQHYQLYVPTLDSAAGSFGGWFSEAGGVGIQYTDAKGNSLLPWDLTEGAELHAFWIDETLTFTLSEINGKVGYMVSAGARIHLVREVTIPTTHQNLPVLMIAGNAFAKCTNLEVVNIPETLEEISLIDPFEGCTGLEAVNVYDVEGASSARYWSEDGVLFDNETSSGTVAKLLLMPLAKTGTYRIPEGIVEIPESAFAGSALSGVIIPAGVTKIGNDAFSDCTRLTSIVFESAAAGESEKSLTIGKRAFGGCVSLGGIVLPARLTEIAITRYTVTAEGAVTVGTDDAFTGCSALTSVTVASGSKNYRSVDGILYSADGRALYYCPATRTGIFTVPAATQTIAPGAFIGCYGLTEISLPSSVTYVGECAFYGLDITKLTFIGNGFNNVTVGRYAFRDCKELAEVVTEPGSRLAVLSEGAFYGCNELTSFEIPATMVSIEADAFRDCTSLESVTFADGGSGLSFGENVFHNCSSIESIHLPSNLNDVPPIFSGCASLREVTVSENNPNLSSHEGVLFNKDKTKLIYFPQGKTGEYTLPKTVEVIADGVFRDMTEITKLVLPNTLTEIGADAFRNSEIGSIVFEGDTLGESLSIGASAFENATLTTLVLPSHTTTLGEAVFRYATFTSIVLNEGIVGLPDYAFFNADGESVINIPSSVRTIGAQCFFGAENGGVWDPETSELELIGDEAFRASPLTSITIPATVTSIGNRTFYDCGQLASVTFAPDSSLKTIGAYAFAHLMSGGCRLHSITLPASLTAIGAYAFEGCSLESVVFEDGGTEDLVLGTPYAVTSVNDNDETVVTVYRGNVFRDCTSLSYVKFPSNLVEIGKYSFYNAGQDLSSGSLTVDFGVNSRLATIGEYAFCNARLESITIPKSVRNLEPVVDDEFGESYDRLGIGAYAFYYKPLFGSAGGITSVVFEKGGTEPLTIGKNAFASNVNMSTIVFPSRLAPYTSYDGSTVLGLANGAGVFLDASNMSSVTVESGCKYYSTIDGVVYTSDYSELIYCPVKKSGAITVPAGVTKINDKAFAGCTGLTAIYFKGGTAELTIGDEAFAGCTSITRLVLPTNAVSLGESAFLGCTSLESLTLSKNLKSFNGSMISGCTSLAAISVESGSSYFYSDDTGVLYDAEMTTLIFYPLKRAGTAYTVPSTVTVIDASAFRGNTSIQNITLPAGLTEIRSDAFNGCSSLTAVNIPNTVELIGDNAFYDCRALTSLTVEKGGTGKLVIGSAAFYYNGFTALELPARVTDIGDRAFYYSSLASLTFEDNSRLTAIGSEVFRDTKLVSVVFPSGIVSFGDSVFEDCYDLESVTFGEGLIYVGNNAFKFSSIKTVSFPSTLTTIGKDVFYYCSRLKTVNFAPGCQLEAIPAGTFYECTSLESITIPAYVKEIGDKDTADYKSRGAFEGNDSLRSVTFEPNGKLSRIGAYAFYDCTALVRLDVPRSVSTLGEGAFYGCTALEGVSIPVTTTRLGEMLFYNCSSLYDVDLQSGATVLPANMFNGCSSLAAIKIPASVSEIGTGCFMGTSIGAFEVADGNSHFAAVNGILYNADRTAIVAFPPMIKITSITIPKEFTSIDASLFRNMPDLKTVIFEEGGTRPLTIGDYAFADCYQLHTVILPERLTSIGEGAFENCYSLYRITIPESVTRIDSGAFSNCVKLVEVYNKSDLDISAGAYYSNGNVGYYAKNVYTPDEGAPIVNVDADGFVTAVITVSDGYRFYTYNYLIGYVGDDVNIRLPEGFTAFYDYAFYMNTSLMSMIIPSNVGTEYMGAEVFVGCERLYLFMDGVSKPAAWADDWNNSRPVTWGYDGKEHTYSFVSNGGIACAPVTSVYAITLPVPERDGYVFGGWYDNAALDGSAISGAYYSTDRTTLYARWMTEEEYLYFGKSFDTAIDLKMQTYTVSIVDAGTMVYFKLELSGPGGIRIVTGGGADARIFVFDGNREQLLDYDNGYEEDYIHSFTEGGTYYIGIRYFNSYVTGEFPVSFSRVVSDGSGEPDEPDVGLTLESLAGTWEGAEDSFGDIYNCEFTFNADGTGSATFGMVNGSHSGSVEITAVEINESTVVVTYSDGTFPDTIVFTYVDGTLTASRGVMYGSLTLTKV